MAPPHEPPAPDCPHVRRARQEGGPQLEAAMDFARDCARGAVIVNWRGRRLSAAEREDVVQETLVRVLHAITRTRKPVRSLQDWVRGTVALVLKEGGRRDRRSAHENVPDALEDLAGPEVHPPEALLSEERRQHVRACLEKLEPHQREMLLLRYREELSNAAIAERLKKTVKAVEQAIPRALRTVHACLERRRMTP